MINSLVKDSLDLHLEYIRSIPVLSSEKQLELAKNVYHDNCKDSAMQLITSNLRLVVKIANQYKGYNLSQIDLIQEGTIGLMMAVRKYDPYRDIKLISYAAEWIHSYIRKYIQENYSVVKLSTNDNQKRLFWSGEFSNIIESLNEPVKEESDISKQDLLVSDLNQEIMLLSLEEEFELKTNVKEALDKLTEKQRLVAYYRFLSEEKLTFKEIAEILNVSSQRVQELEKAVINNLRKLLKYESLCSSL